MTTVINGDRGSAPEDSCQLHSPPSEWLHTHHATDQSWGNWGLGLEAAFGTLFPAFNNFLTLDSPHQCQQALLRRLSIHVGFNTTLKRKKKKRRKINPTVHVYLREQVCLFASTYGAKWPRVNGNMLQLAMCFRHQERKARTWWGARTEMSTWASTRSPGGNSQVVTWPAMEALYLWGCWYKLRNMQLWKRDQLFVYCLNYSISLKRCTWISPESLFSILISER